MRNEALRVRRFLQGGAARVEESAGKGGLLLNAPQRGTLRVGEKLFRELLELGAIMRDGEAVRLAPGSKNWERFAESPDALAPARREVEVAQVADAGRPDLLLVNHAESPLAALVRRRSKDGAPFLSAGEFGAGERLRADFTRGSLMPRLGANWEAAVASGRRHGGGGVADLGDAALAARLRVERALAAVGPELSGVLIDVCCFLKGLEQVESERGWPVRSAKIVLKSALGALSRHYDPRPGRAPGILHWGAGDFRPQIK